MTGVEARASYRRALAAIGEPVVIRRGSVDVTVQARITGYTPEEMASGMMQGNRKVIASAEDLEASGFELPLVEKSTDAVILQAGTSSERKMTIVAVDDMTRRVGGVLVAYELQVVG